MAKVRQHDTALARQEAEGHQQAASAKYPAYSNEWFAELQLLKLQDTADKGLWSCHESFERSLADFYADFSWDGRMARQIEIMLADPDLVVKVIRQTGEWLPVSFQQDNVGIYQEAVAVEGDSLIVRSKLVDDLRQFMRIWDSALREQGFVDAARKPT